MLANCLLRVSLVWYFLLCYIFASAALLPLPHPERKPAQEFRKHVCGRRMHYLLQIKCSPVTGNVTKGLGEERRKPRWSHGNHKPDFAWTAISQARICLGWLRYFVKRDLLMSLDLHRGVGSDFLPVPAGTGKAPAIIYHQERGAGVKQLNQLCGVGPYTQAHATLLSLAPKATRMLWHPRIGSAASGERSCACSLVRLSPRYFTTRYKNP